MRAQGDPGTQLLAPHPAEDRATATDAGQPTPGAPYYARKPGPCDSGEAVWTRPEKNHISCEHDGSRFTGKGETLTHFEPPEPLPDSFRTSLVASGMGPTTCVAFVVKNY
ncbi:hypothetical protein CW362_22590 [Streptomyces populi]|uniref:Uncharacterized protein n=1 Tax=Streptomyces populi TaxID=2058924 RepID=A0A2I0SLL3_9ACTN|nr:hypothetical protein [Streptomyces populi]PKT70813.1 hypothetical protein CW362_22590 [Streptomyces populi]